MKKINQPRSRRCFLKQCAGVLAGSATMSATLTRLQLANAQAVGNDYKALVCIFLFGGNDSYNLIVPTSSSQYQTYSDVRQNLAIAQDELLSISPITDTGVAYGFHPSMSSVRDLFENDTLSVIANVGSLVEPVTKSTYLNNTAVKPPQLFSHNDQQNFVQSLSTGIAKNGWAGRAADTLASINDNQRLSMNISLSGSNIWQSGRNVIPYSISGQGISTLTGLDGASVDGFERNRAEIYRTLLENSQSHLFEQEFSRVQLRAWDLAAEISVAINDLEPIETVFPEGNRLATDLKMIAQLISARDALDVRRQVYFVGMGGFDTHGGQNNTQPELLSTLSEAMNAFNSSMIELGVQDNVTTFTASDFGRTLTSNGDGTDHGWGGHQLVMGGAVRGREIYGQMPSLEINSDDDIGEGRIIPTTSIDQYGATLASWFGLQAQDFSDVFPNLANFDSVDLGFMNNV